jgi:Hemerythrin HHE cation binding domain.
MENDTLAAALEREHRDIDQGIETFTTGLAAGDSQTESLRRAMDALRRHIYLEEEFLFPPLRQAGLVAPIFVMLREHGQLWKTLETLDTALGEKSLGASVPQVCAELVAQLQAHNSKEEPIIYPQADTVLTPAGSAQLKAFLDSAQTPDGWVCHGAQS